MTESSQKHTTILDVDTEQHKAPDTDPKTEPKLKTNLDTDFLKLIAIISMAIDHFGGEFFPQYPIFRWFGRLAFPLFCYCLTVGLLYTRNVKKYVGRLAIFAVISQPIYALNVDRFAFWENLTNWNIFFTLVISLLFMWGITHRKWYGIGTAVLSLALLLLFNFDYSSTGILLMMIFRFCRNKPILGAALFCLHYLPALWGTPGDPLALVIGGHTVDWSIFSLLAAPLIFISTNTRIKVNKWFFYIFYPAHLAVIVVIQCLLSIK